MPLNRESGSRTTGLRPSCLASFWGRETDSGTTPYTPLYPCSGVKILGPLMGYGYRDYLPRWGLSNPFRSDIFPETVSGETVLRMSATGVGQRRRFVLVPVHTLLLSPLVAGRSSPYPHLVSDTGDGESKWRNHHDPPVER